MDGHALYQNVGTRHAPRVYAHLRAVCALLAFAAFSVAPRAEEFFSYVDRAGCLVFTNRPPPGTVSRLEKHEIQRARPDLVQYDAARFNRFDGIIMENSRAFGVDYNLIKAVILVESNFNPNALSHMGAMGLMQLIAPTAKRLGVENPYNPAENVRGGTQYLKYLLDMFGGDLRLALASYNAGENLVKKIRRVPDIRETQSYVKKILEIYGGDTHLSPQAEEAEVSQPPVDRLFIYKNRDGVITLTNMDPPSGAVLAR